MPVPSIPQPIDPAEAARRRQVAVIASRIRASRSVAAVLAERAYGTRCDPWPTEVRR